MLLDLRRASHHSASAVEKSELGLTNSAGGGEEGIVALARSHAGVCSGSQVDRNRQERKTYAAEMSPA